MTKNSLKIPQWEFHDSLAEQADYLCFTAELLINQQFIWRYFAVLPYLKTYNANTIYFPDLSYPAGFWLKIKHLNYNAGQRFPSSITKAVRKILPAMDLSRKTKRTKDCWSKQWPEFWSKINQSGIFKKEQKKLKKIIILLTPFGPNDSPYYYARRKLLYLAFRINQPTFDLARSIVSGLVLIKNGYHEGNENKWLENRSIVNFLAKTDLFKSTIYQPTTKKDILESQKFLKKLGLAGKNKFKIKNSLVFFAEKNFSRRLSFQQNLILKELISLSGGILTYDRLAEILWGAKENEKFSLWAIAKAVQKLRLKLEKNSANPFLIRTIYNQGYVLD